MGTRRAARLRGALNHSTRLEPPVAIDSRDSARQAMTGPHAGRPPLGPLDTLHLVWLGGLGCNGCSLAAIGATNPSLEDLQRGTVPGMPRVILHHATFGTDPDRYLDALHDAADGR